jgi:hypothetical protein
VSSAAVAPGFDAQQDRVISFGQRGIVFRVDKTLCKEYANLPPHKVSRFTVDFSTGNNSGNTRIATFGNLSENVNNYIDFSI